MSERYYNISLEEMDSFLRSHHFVEMNIRGTIELVYGKIVKIGKHALSLRIYTGINPSGESRPKGTDAIRVQLYYMYNNIPTLVGKTIKCLRVKNWRNNLLNAIEKYENNFKICPVCNFPMVERVNKTTGEKFWGCVTWHQTNCSGRKKTLINECK
jgi:hypothetical protein